MQWNPALECGVELIDNEHKELFNMVCDLRKSLKEGNSKEAAGEALDFLGNYVATHFSHEEELMKQCGYPKAEEHKELHEKFIKTFLALKEKFYRNNGSPEVTTEIIHTAMSWLVNHINMIDQRFTDYYKAYN